MINTYPDIRFTQLLYNMGIDNTEHRYFVNTVKRVKFKINKSLN